MTERSRVSWLSAGLDDVPSDDSWMDEFERTRIGGMRFAKRRTEALLARYTAKATIAGALGLPGDPASLSRVTVRNAPDGAPEAFVDGDDAGVVIAMTDRADWAVCSVLHGPARVGCDLELVEPRSAAFIADYFTPAEQDLLAGATAERTALLANLVWSAKESALKVLRTGLRRDTRTVEVRLDEPTGDGWQPLGVHADGRTMPGWWVQFGEFLLTCVAATPVEAPASLVEPPPLAGAVPSHRWMENPLS